MMGRHVRIREAVCYRVAGKPRLSAEDQREQAIELLLTDLLHVLTLRDTEMAAHSKRVAEMAVFLGRALGLSHAELVQMRRGALLHDIGKLGIPDSILLKEGALTQEEWMLIQQHPVYAYEMLSPIYYLRSALDVPYCHHERWDGTGYPRGLKGEEIPLSARIVAVVDVWDALCSDRPYREAWPPAQVRAYISRLANTHFDPKVARKFLQILPDSAR
jgi:HD-GYP domain-containing protein (c-di-GMP phosphodiesterase class II)